MAEQGQTSNVEKSNARPSPFVVLCVTYRRSERGTIDHHQITRIPFASIGFRAVRQK